MFWGSKEWVPLLLVAFVTSSNGLQPTSDGLQPNGDGLHPSSFLLLVAMPGATGRKSKRRLLVM